MCDGVLQFALLTTKTFPRSDPAGHQASARTAEQVAAVARAFGLQVTVVGDGWGMLRFRGGALTVAEGFCNFYGDVLKQEASAMQLRMHARVLMTRREVEAMLRADLHDCEDPFQQLSQLRGA